MNSFFSTLVVLLIVLTVAFVVFYILWIVRRSTRISYNMAPLPESTKYNKSEVTSNATEDELEVTPIVENTKNKLKDADNNSITNNSIEIILNPNFRTGKITFNTPETMYYKKPVIVVLKITDNLLEEPKIEEEGIIETEKIDVYDSMKAELTGTGFDIKPLTQETQLVLKNKIVTWRWAITPNMLGNQRLFLNIYAIFQIGIARESVNLNTFERVIKVKVNRRERLKNLLRFLGWLLPGGAITSFISKHIIDYLKYKNWINLPF